MCKLQQITHKLNTAEFVSDLPELNIDKNKKIKGSLTVWALYTYFSDSQNAAFALLVWCM